jgi:hypothetical protein
MNTPNPQPILASSSDELYNPFSEEARISPHNPYILLEPVPCPINGGHFSARLGFFQGKCPLNC